MRCILLPSFASVLIASSPVPAEPVATYEDVTLPRERLVEFVLETRGLDALLNLMQMEIAADLARRQGLEVTDADVAAEEKRTLQNAFVGILDIDAEDLDSLRDQLLERQQVARAEWDVVMRTNAIIRKMAEAAIAPTLTEDLLRQAFNSRYGEQVRARHIAADNLEQLGQVRRRLDAGESFEDLAREVSRDRYTGPQGGLLPAFSRQSDLPEAFRAAAFALDVGDVSDPVEAGGTFHLIRLDERIEPRAVRFESVKDELREQLVVENSQLAVRQVRAQITAAMASDKLQIRDPALAEQLRQRLDDLEPQPMTGDDVRRQLERQRDADSPGR